MGTFVLVVRYDCFWRWDFKLRDRKAPPRTQELKLPSDGMGTLPQIMKTLLFYFFHAVIDESLKTGLPKTALGPLATRILNQVPLCIMSCETIVSHDLK